MRSALTSDCSSPLEMAWRAAYEAAVVLPGWSTGLVTLVGPDGLRFANSMFTQRFDDLELGAARSSAYTDAKGRMLGLLDGWRVDENQLVVLLDGASVESFEARYGRYIVLDDVELESISEPFSHLTLLGPQARAVAADAGMELQDHIFAHRGGWVLPTTRYGHAVVELVLPKAEAEALLKRLSGSVSAGQELWQRLRVEAGAPRWPHDMSDKEMVHTMGLREQVLHFEKGCYIGQETIHRLDVMGKLRKRFGALVATKPITVGSEVHHSGKKVGVLTSVIAHPKRGYIGLGVLRDPASSPGEPLEVHEPEGVVVATAVRRPVPDVAPS